MTEPGDRKSPTADRESLEIEKLRIEISQLNDKSERDQLERQKSALEVRDLQRHWYRKPQYVLAALPTALAIVGIIIGFYSGYFKEKIANLQQEKTQLTEETKKSRDELTKLNETVGKTSKDLDAITTAKNALDTQVTSLNGDLNRDQTETIRAQGDYAKLTERRQELEVNVRTLEVSATNAELKGLTELWLENGKPVDDRGLLSETGKEVRFRLNKLFIDNPPKRKQYESFFENYLSQPETTPVQYMYVVTVLIEITGDREWRDRLVSMTRSYIRAAQREPDKYRDVLTRIGVWARSLPDTTLRDYVLKQVADELDSYRANKVNDYFVLDAFFKYVEFPPSPYPPLHRSNPALFLKIVRVACDFERGGDGGRLLSRTAPVVLVALIARRILTEPNYELTDFEFATLSDESETPGLEPPRERDAAKWRQWAQRPLIRRLVKLWLEENDFHTLLRDTSLINRVVEDHRID